MSGAPGCFVVIEAARATANVVRQATAAQAILASPPASPDQPDRFTMALFPDKMKPDPARCILSVSAEGSLRLG